jgi:hypothetical protein
MDTNVVSDETGTTVELTRRLRGSAAL